MKRTLAMGTIMATLCAAMAAGCATNSTPEADAARLASGTAGKDSSQEFCVRETGSRIKMQEGKCIGPGRTYTREELERTGAIDTAEALQRLDPRIR